MLDPYSEHELPLPYQEEAQEQTQPVREDPEADPVLHIPASIPLPPAMQPNNSRTSSSSRARNGTILALTLLLSLIFGVGLFAGWQFSRMNTGAPGTGTTIPSSTGVLQQGTGSIATVPPLTASNEQAVREAVIAKIRPAVVQVNVSLQGNSAIGSGVIIDRRGYIVTNNHVVDGAQSIEVVLYDDTHLLARLVGTDPADDLAVLKITTNKILTVATLGDSTKLQVGQDVLVIGNPLGITQSVTSGIISALGRSVSEGQNGTTIPNAIQTDAPINPGNSGGALVDLQGNLIGIPTLGAIDPEFNTPANGVGFAIPSNRVSFLVPQIIATGTVTHTGRAILGVTVTSVDAALVRQDNLSVDHGVFIVSVISNGPADSAGLQAGDVIVQIGGQAVNDVNTLGAMLGNKNPVEVVSVHVYRGNQQMTVNVKLGELPAV